MADTISENEIFKSFIDVIPYLAVLFEYDASFGLADLEKYIFAQEGKGLNLSTKIGSPLLEGGAGLRAIRSGKVIIKDVSEEVYGVPFKSFAIPIIDKAKNTIGVFLVGKSLVKRNELLNISQNLSASMQQMEGTMDEYCNEIVAVCDFNKKVLVQTEEANEGVKNTDGVLRFIENIAKQTNLLGLNASIEAARTGEIGKGFAVVADEIRKLSKSSGDSIQKIDKVLKQIIDSTKNINGNVKEVNNILEQQANNLPEIIHSIKDLSSMAQVLQKMSEEL